MRYVITFSAFLFSTGCTGRALDIPEPPTQVRATMPDGTSVVMTCLDNAYGPSAAEEEQAMRLTWEGVLHMETASRPVVTWLLAPVAAGGVSFVGSIDADGRVSVLWQGSIACSQQWPIMLGAWKRVLFGASTADAFIAAQGDSAMLNATTAALISAGI